jgi:sulfite exporter TauE/SafE
MRRSIIRATFKIGGVLFLIGLLTSVRCVAMCTDINDINPDDIKREVAAWTAPAGSGCCGG